VRLLAIRADRVDGPDVGMLGVAALRPVGFPHLDCRQQISRDRVDTSDASLRGTRLVASAPQAVEAMARVRPASIRGPTLLVSGSISSTDSGTTWPLPAKRPRPSRSGSARGRRPQYSRPVAHSIDAYR
jgi:hypothetical protein